eukprot:766778-Hanusia_phi.AAC.9
MNQSMSQRPPRHMKQPAQIVRSSRDRLVRARKNIMALAEFKSNEKKLVEIASSNLAEAVECHAVEGAWDSKSPVTKKRESKEISGDKDQQKKDCTKASKDEPIKKKAKMNEKDMKGSPVEMKTPSFSRFGGARTSSVSSARRSTSAPRHRPSATPSSSCKTPSSVCRAIGGTIGNQACSSFCFQAHGPHQPEAFEQLPHQAPSLQLRLDQLESELDPIREELQQVRSFLRSSTPLSDLTRFTDSIKSSSSYTPSRLTVPKSPKLSHRSSSRPRREVDSESRQMEEAQAAIENMKKRRKVSGRSRSFSSLTTLGQMGEARLKGMLQPKGEAGAMVTRSTKGLTVPVSPNLRTSLREKSVSDCDTSDAELPLGERLRQKTGKTPPKSNMPLKLTEPKTPEFSSFRRSARHVKSQAEREEEELQEMKKKQFKARPLNDKILSSCGDLGVPKVRVHSEFGRQGEVVTRPWAGAEKSSHNALRSSPPLGGSSDALSLLLTRQPELALH